MASPESSSLDFDPLAFGEPLPITQATFENALRQLPAPQEIAYRRTAYVELLGGYGTELQMTVINTSSLVAGVGEENPETSTIELRYTDSDGHSYIAHSLPDTSLTDKGAQKALAEQQEVTTCALEVIEDHSGEVVDWIRTACKSMSEQGIFRSLAAEQLIASCPRSGTVTEWRAEKGTHHFRDNAIIATHAMIPIKSPVNALCFVPPSRVRLQQSDGTQYDYTQRANGNRRLIIAAPGSDILVPSRPSLDASPEEMGTYMRALRTARYSLKQAVQQGAYTITDGSLWQLTGAIEAVLASGTMPAEQ